MASATTLSLGNLWLFPSDLKKFLAINPANIKKALLFATPIPPLGFILIGFGVLILLFAEGLIRYRQRKQSRRSRKAYQIQSAKKFIYWMAALPFALGVQSLLGLPEWFEVGIFVFFMYFAPFTSPQELKHTMKLPEEKRQNPKSVLDTENVG